MANPTLNVWVLSAEYQPYILGGLGVVATTLARELTQLGARVTVIASTPKASVSIRKGKNLTVVRFPKRYSSGMMAKFLSAHQITPPDLIHVHSLQFIDLLQHYRAKTQVPAVYTCHSVVHKQANRVYTPQRQLRLLRSVDQVVVPSVMAKDELVTRYPFSAGKTTVIPHGVQVPSVSEPAVDQYRLLYAGRLVRNKGLEELIDAMALLRVRYPQVRLAVIGDGTITTKLKQRARRRGIARLVRWLGPYGHGRLLRAYGKYGAVVMPSKSESFGLVALEALAAGVPLVATQAGGLSQFISDEVAQVIKRVDAPTIARAITQIWQEPALTQQRMQSGRELAHRYQWNYAARSYLQLFEALVAAGV